MEPSPLTQDARPDYFQPKVVQLYEQLFLHDHDTDFPTEGFWREFFLLRPDKAGLVQVLDSISPDELLHLQGSTQELFLRCIREGQNGRYPENANAFETLTAFLGGVLNKRYTNPSSDVIEVLAGLDEVDTALSSLVACIESIVRATRIEGDVATKRAAVNTALSMTSGAYQTGIVSYFTHKDLFPALMKNPYQLRLDDFVNDATIQRIVRGVGAACIEIRNQYVSVQEDLPESWNLNSALIFFGLRSPTPEAKAKSAPPSEAEAKELFGSLPGSEAAILLPTYSFLNANKLFATNLTTLPSPSRSSESPFSAFLSLTSYLTHHAHRSQRCLHYSLLTLFTLRIITEDPVIMKRVTSLDSKLPVRLCRQRAPHLPLVTSDRIPVTAIMDICTATLSHNLRKRLDVPLYSTCIAIILRIVTFLSHNKIRLSHHWAYIWGSLISLMRFLTQYSTDLLYSPEIRESLCTPLTDLIAFCLSSGDSFLPDPSSYDDLFYKLIEAGPVLTKFRDSYNLAPAPSSSEPTTTTSTSAITPAPNGTHTDPSTNPTSTATHHSIQTLLHVSTHYHNLLTSSSTHHPRHQSASAVASVIKQGYDTLDIPTPPATGSASTTSGHRGFGATDIGGQWWYWSPWREASEKALLKRIIRTAVEDARRWVVASPVGTGAAGAAAAGAVVGL